MKTLDISSEQYQELLMLGNICNRQERFDEAQWVSGVRKIIGDIDFGQCMLRVVPNKIEHIVIIARLKEDNHNG